MPDQTYNQTSQLQSAETASGPAIQVRSEARLNPFWFSILLLLLILAAFPGVMLRGQTFTARDFGMFSSPAAYFHRQAFWHGTLPSWNPYNYCGLPFLAQWNTMVFYPGAIIYLVLPLPWSLSFFCLAHLLWAGLGMYFLSRSWTRNQLAAGIAGVAFAFNGLTLNFIMWPSHIATISWLPWVLWLGPQGWQKGGSKLFWAVLVASLQMLAGGPETILLTWMLLFCFAATDFFETSRERSRPDGPVSIIPSLRLWREYPACRRDILIRFFGLGLLVALLCSIQLLPFLRLLMNSERSSSYSASSHDWSMPSWGLANFLLPLFHTVPSSQNIFFPVGQYWTSSYYLGIGTIFLAAIAAWRVRAIKVRILVLLVILSLILALGDNGFLFKALRILFPGIGFVRYSVKFVILVCAVSPLLAALGMAELLKHGSRRFEHGLFLTLFLSTGCLIVVEAKAPLVADTFRFVLPNGLLRLGFLGGAFLVTAGLIKSSGRARLIWGCSLLVIISADLVTQVPSQNPSIPSSLYSRDIARVQLKPEEQPGLGQGRVMLSPEAEETLRLNSLPNLQQHYLVRRLASYPDCNLLDGIPQTYGFYSLTPGQIANLANLPYVQKNLDFSRLMDFMGVTRTTKPGTLFDWTQRPTAMPLVTAGQRPMFVSDQVAIDNFFETNTDFRRVVYLPPELRSRVTAKECPEASILGTRFENQRTVVNATAKDTSLVVVSESWYPAWGVTVDGIPATLLRANYAFQAVQVSPGTHTVIFEYRDLALHLGTLLSSVGLAAWLLLGYASKRGAPLLSGSPVSNN